ncbi:DEAD/DEAH box helicase [Salegentibacter maritimus]|uniref:DEAD/DEAH box helicase n=1 Tax=Salegentibacter maritimus TaxID=2794347 RepID=UPI0018E468AD|nr:DEAD/DEAH box helicase [Salegentibacter maritimus]MBI6117954.1 DEAD/DEAH box helicase [Salegentibacter maritimus]
MSLAVFYKYYKISPRELKEILKKENIIPDLRFVKEVPEEWNEIVSEELNIPPLKQAEGKAQTVSSTTGSDDLVEKRLKSFDELEKLKENDVPTSKKSRSGAKKNKKKRDRFFAYVKYIAPDKSHAFVKKIEDLNAIGSVNLRTHDNSFKIQKGVEDLEENQILLVEEGFHNLAYIKELYFTGLALKSVNHFKITGGKRDAFSVNSRVRFPKEFTDAILSTVKFTFNGHYLDCEPVNVNSKIDPISHLQKQVERILPKKELNEEDQEIFKLYTKLSETPDLEEKLRIQFEVEIENPIKLDPEQQFDVFLSKWLFLKPEWVNINTFKHLEKADLYFVSWLDFKLPVSFWNEHLLDACIQYEQSVNSEAKEARLSFVASLNDKHLEAISEAIIEDEKKELLIESLDVYMIYQALIDIAPIEDKESFYNKIRNSIKAELKFDLWLTDENAYLPKKEAIKRFDSQTAEVQERILKGLPMDDIVPLVPKLRQVENTKIKSDLILWAGNVIQKNFSVISFDLESDKKSIFEIAWNAGDTWRNHKGEKDVKEALPDFKELTTKTNYLFTGHNIIDFDCPILEAQGVICHRERLWDTLLMEMLLRPYLKSYALITGHRAEQDAKLTLDLFKNQVLRILKFSVEEFEKFSEVLSSPVINNLWKLREELPLQWLEEDELEETDKFFRPQAKRNSIYTSVAEAISKSKVSSKIIVGPEIAQREFLDFPEIEFLNKEQEQEFLLLDTEKISALGRDKGWLKQVLANFIQHSVENDLKPYWGRLSTAIQLKITEQIDYLELLRPLPSLDWNKENILFVTVDELNDLRPHTAEIPKSDFFLIYPDLISVSNKTMLREIDMDYIISLNLDSHFWMKFSGGQSFVSISKEECESLQAEVPNHFTNFWIEKYQYSKFRIWGNYNWEKLVEDFSVNDKILITSDTSSSGKEQKYFAKINISPNQNKAIIRFNPESIYRSRYWVFQRELIDQVIDPGDSAVLLIQQHKEVESLETYFRSLGYYIPSRDASMGRRLELLHSGHSGKNIIIDTPEKINTILNANHSGSLTVILDSFNLAEKLHIAKESEYFKNLVRNHSLASTEDVSEETNEEESDEEFSDTGKLGKPLNKDTFFKLKLEKPLISYYSDLVFSNNPGNKFWILDPRVSDFPDYGKSWGAKSRSINLWKDNDLYEEDVKHADKNIISPKPLEELPFSLEDTKKILSSIFLGGGEWYDYQHPCLDEILPGREDVMVSLPTGGGKSLLFQAPALFRSAFTNKMTIVITPLKALMEDQVYNLWEQGFYGSVEYLNSDRSTDTPLIYRALAGGEISLLFITPERFRSRAFFNALEVRMQSDGGLEYAVFDEAHCLSQWGHEFRPDYFNAAKTIHKFRMSSRIPLLLFSATVSEKIFNDFKSIFDVKETVSR